MAPCGGWLTYLNSTPFNLYKKYYLTLFKLFHPGLLQEHVRSLWVIVPSHNKVSLTVLRFQLCLKYFRRMTVMFNVFSWRHTNIFLIKVLFELVIFCTTLRKTDVMAQLSTQSWIFFYYYYSGHVNFISIAHHISQGYSWLYNLFFSDYFDVKEKLPKNILLTGRETKKSQESPHLRATRTARRGTESQTKVKHSLQR